jgi:hypothetical protein
VTRSIVPPSRPQATRETVLSYIDGPLPPFPFLVARRGYYGDTMGLPDANDIGLYDDAMWLVERSDLMAFNANCDPGRHQTGMANLTAGRWRYRQYEALIQAATVVVFRDGTEDHAVGSAHPKYGECVGRGLWRGYFGINIHCGGIESTSSLGCQTIPRAQWGDIRRPILPSFMGHVHRAMNAERRGLGEIAYILTSRY